MATKPITAAFPDLVLEVETEIEGTFAKVCALTQRGYFFVKVEERDPIQHKRAPL